MSAQRGGVSPGGASKGHPDACAHQRVLLIKRAQEGAIAGLQDALSQLWSHYQPGFTAAHGPGVSRGNVSYAASVVSER